MTRKYIALDFETPQITPDIPYPYPVCLSTFDKEEREGKLYIGDEQEPILREMLNSDCLMIAQNAVFETLVIYCNFPHLRELLIKKLDAGEIYCTSEYEQLKNNVEESKVACHNKSLAGLMKHYFNIDLSASKKGDDIWRLRYDELICVPREKGIKSLEDINLERAKRALKPTEYDYWPKDAIDYAINDSVYAMMVYEKQRKVNPYLEFAQHIRASHALNFMPIRGIYVDLDRVGVLQKELDEILIPIFEKLHKAGFVKKNNKGKFVKNQIRLKEYIEETFETKLTTSKGTTSIDKEALKAYLREKDDEILRDFTRIGKYEKAKSAFANRLAKANPANPVVRTRYRPIVTTGRTSSSTSGLDPCSVNIQQQPGGLEGVTYDIRGCMRAREGFKFVSVDYNNLELLATAHQLYKFYGKSKMRDMINMGDEPTDLHSVFACALMSADTGKQISYEEYLPHKKEKGYKEYRKKGKPVTLGCPGGMGYKTIRGQFLKDGIELPYKIVATFNNEYTARKVVRDYSSEYPDLRAERTSKHEYSVVRDEVVKLRNLLYNTYPELQWFLKEGHKKFLTGKTKWKKNDFGEWEKDELYRYSVFGQVQDNCTYTGFCNAYLMQGTSSVGAKEAAWQLFKEFHDSEEVHILAFIHDEFCAEVADNENFMKNVDKISEIMVDCQMKYLDSVDVAVEAEWMTYWSKEVNEGSRQYYKKQSDKILRTFD